MCSLASAQPAQPEIDLFLSRVLEALTHLVTVPDSRSLAETGGANDALVRMLERPEVLAELRPRDPLAPARLRGLRLQQEILAAEGGTCSARSLADALGMTRQAKPRTCWYRVGDHGNDEDRRARGEAKRY